VLSHSLLSTVLITRLVAGTSTLHRDIWRNSCSNFSKVFTARRYATAVLAGVVCLSVRPSVRLLHAGIVSKRLNNVPR